MPSHLLLNVLLKFTYAGVAVEADCFDRDRERDKEVVGQDQRKSDIRASLLFPFIHLILILPVVT